MDDDYVIGYTVDDDFYCVTFDMQAARVPFTSWKWKLCKTTSYELRPVDSGEVPH